LFFCLLGFSISLFFCGVLDLDRLLFFSCPLGVVSTQSVEEGRSRRGGAFFCRSLVTYRDHDGAWLTGRAACELPMGFGQPGQRTELTGHALRVLHRRDHRSRHPSLCRCSCCYDRGGPRGGVAAAQCRCVLCLCVCLVRVRDCDAGNCCHR